MRQAYSILAAALAAGLLTPSVAAARLAPPAVATPVANTVSPLVLTAPEKQKELVDKTTEFVRQRLPVSRFEQYARYNDPVCVKVIGLPPEFDAFIARRVGEVARQVNAPVDANPKCAPNVNVIFSPKPQAQLDDIARRRDILFGFHFQAEMKKLTTFSRPVQAWYVTRTTDTHGNKVLELAESIACITSSPLAPPCDVKAPAVVGRAGSRLGNDMSSELVHSLIIADAGKVAGSKIDAVADYVAVLALSRWQYLERCSGLPTILNLMADGCEAEDRPEAATPNDLALLAGLYAASPRDSGPLQRASIASAVRKAAAADEGKH